MGWPIGNFTIITNWIDLKSKENLMDNLKEKASQAADRDFLSYNGDVAFFAEKCAEFRNKLTLQLVLMIWRNARTVTK